MNQMNLENIKTGSDRRKQSVVIDGIKYDSVKDASFKTKIEINRIRRAIKRLGRYEFTTFKTIEVCLK